MLLGFNSCGGKRRKQDGAEEVELQLGLRKLWPVGGGCGTVCLSESRTGLQQQAMCPDVGLLDGCGRVPSPQQAESRPGAGLGGCPLTRCPSVSAASSCA